MVSRLDVFGTREVRRGRRLVAERVAWQGWNPDPRQEAALGRLPGSGSFYWPDEAAAVAEAARLLRTDPSVDAVRVRGIGNQDVEYLTRANLRRVADAWSGQLDLLEAA